MKIVTIQQAVADEFGVTVMQLTAATRKAPIVRARHTAMSLTRELTGFSFQRIAKSFGRYDHTTVLHALAATIERVNADPELGERMDRIRLALGRDAT